MADYEATAFLSLEKLKEKHIVELQSLSESVRANFTMKFRQSKALVDLRKQQKVYMVTKHYLLAEEVK